MFIDRCEAGKLLGVLLKDRGKQDLSTVVLGIPRGGVVVAKEVAKILNCSLDVVMVKKVGAPENAELAIGAIGETKGARYLDSRLAKQVGADKKYLEQEIKIQKLEIKRREKIYRQNKKSISLNDKTVIIVDDGAATGATVIAAAREVWNNKPKKVIIALPVLAKDILDKLEKEADEVIYLEAPAPFFSVGQFYQDFQQINDKQVIKLLNF